MEKKMNWLDYLKGALARQVPQDRVEGAHQSRRSRQGLEYLRTFLLRYWKKGLLASSLLLIASLLAFPQPMITKYLFDDVILAKRVDLLAGAILLLVLVKGAEVVFNLLQRYTFTRFEQNVSLEIQQDLLDHTLRLPKSFFDAREVGYLTSRLSSDVQGLRWFFSSSMVSILASVIKLVGGAIFIFYLEWRLGLATIVLLPVLVLATRFFSEKMRALSHHGMEQNANVQQRYQETLASLPLVKAFASEERESRRIVSELQSSRQIEMESSVLGSLANLAIGLVPELARGVVLVAGAWLVIGGQWTIGSLLAFLSYLGYVYSPALTIAFANLQVQNALAAMERVLAIRSLVPEENMEGGIPVERLLGEIEFEQVTFAYDGETSILEDVSFHIHPGERIGIAGPSGVGKTSLISLVLCFYRPLRGSVRFDGRDGAAYNLRSLRQRIGYVSQAALLLSGTIHENISYGNLEASQEEVESAARLAGIHDYIRSLPEGYQTRLGERGVNLSEGQRQRLAIARAVLKNPDILILDEATASLDSIVERFILEGLPESLQHRTMLIISHRASTLQKTDRVMLFKEKHLIACGTHQELSEGNDFYRSLTGQSNRAFPDGTGGGSE